MWCILIRRCGFFILMHIRWYLRLLLFLEKLNRLSSHFSMRKNEETRNMSREDSRFHVEIWSERSSKEEVYYLQTKKSSPNFYFSCHKPQIIVYTRPHVKDGEPTNYYCPLFFVHAEFDISLHSSETSNEQPPIEEHVVQ